MRERADHAWRGFRKLTDYEEVEESIAPQAKVQGNKLDAEFKNTVLSANVEMDKEEA